MWIEQTANGKYKACERYIDPISGKTKKASITIEKDTKAARKAAQQALTAKIEKLQTISSTADQDITFKELADLYISHQKKTTRLQTWRRDENIMKNISKVIGDDTKVNKLSARYISSHFSKAKKENVTLNTYLSHIKRMLNWGFREDYVQDVSFLKKLKPYPDADRKARIQDKFLDSSELRVLLDGMEVTRWRLLTQFLALSGLRIGEAMALDNSDVSDVITVNKTADARTQAITKSAKTNAGNREVFVQAELKAAIKEIRSFVLRDQLRAGYRTDIFLPGPDGERFQYYAYNKYLKENSKALLGREITPHALRHTHVSLLAENGVPLDVISRRIGHEDSSVTRQIYLHITQKQKEKDNQIISEIKII